MNIIWKSEKMTIILGSILCLIVLVNIVLRIRTILPYRGNCWFCNENFWIRFTERNSWICPGCDQYNGFTKDGDYNRPLFSSSNSPRAAKPHSPPRNGLCKMCNTNQELKVVQLANYIPMNEKNFNEEVEKYRVQLERAYKLCSQCRNVVKRKLHKEKEILLDTQILQTRTKDKQQQIKDIQNEYCSNILTVISKTIVGVILILVCIDIYFALISYKPLIANLKHTYIIVSSFAERIMAVTRLKVIDLYPSWEIYEESANSYIMNLTTPELKLDLSYDRHMQQFSLLSQSVLAGFGCLVTILSHLLDCKISKYVFVADCLWSCLIGILIGQTHLQGWEEILLFGKLVLTAGLLTSHTKKKVKKGVSRRLSVAVKSNSKQKNQANDVDEELSSDECTDDDVSLSKFGIHNTSSSSNDTMHSSALNSTMLSGRAFTPRKNESCWLQSMNSTVKSKTSPKQHVRAGSFIPRPGSIASQTLSNRYKTADDYDSDLDESISGLHLGTSSKSLKSSSSVFSLRKFNATPSFVTPTVAASVAHRPLISPSKLGQSTSWVAGGYWGSEALTTRPIFSQNGSRSSSQSSGFESQTSSGNQRNLNSQPPSREDSVGKESDRQLFSSDRSQASFSGYCSTMPMPTPKPVHPQMRFDGHIHIPQPVYGVPYFDKPLPQYQPTESEFSQRNFMQSDLNSQATKITPGKNSGSSSNHLSPGGNHLFGSRPSMSVSPSSVTSPPLDHSFLKYQSNGVNTNVMSNIFFKPAASNLIKLPRLSR